MDNTVRKAHNSLSDDELVTRCKSKKMIYCGRGKMDGETSIDFLCPRHQRFGIQHRKAYDFSILKVICEYCNWYYFLVKTKLQFTHTKKQKGV